MSSTDIRHNVFTAVDVPPQFEPYIAVALVRIQVLFPALTFRQNDTSIAIGGAAPGEEGNVRKALLHAIYREKIYAETLPLRQDLISAVTAR